MMTHYLVHWYCGPHFAKRYSTISLIPKPRQHSPGFLLATIQHIASNTYGIPDDTSLTINHFEEVRVDQPLNFQI